DPSTPSRPSAAPLPERRPEPLPRLMHARRRRQRRRAADRRAGAHVICDQATAGLGFFLVVFTPWALGTTQFWTIWVANGVCYALGGLLAAKWYLRRRDRQEPVRWGESISVTEASGGVRAARRGGAL